MRGDWRAVRMDAATRAVTLPAGLRLDLGGIAKGWAADEVVRRQLGRRAWRLLHYASFAVFLLALGHGSIGGTDSALGWARLLYAVSGASLLFLTLYRALAPLASARPTVAKVDAGE